MGFFEGVAKKGKPVPVFGGGKVRRTFTHVREICDAVELLLAHGNGVYNVGGRDMSLLDAAMEVGKRHGVSVESVPWPDAALRLESGSTVFDSSRLNELRKEFGHEA